MLAGVWSSWSPATLLGLSPLQMVWRCLVVPQKAAQPYLKLSSFPPRCMHKKSEGISI